jgi:hypothetical protein
MTGFRDGLKDDVVHFANNRIGPLQARTRGQEDNNRLVTNVLIRNEAGGHLRHLEHCEADQAEIDKADDGRRTNEASGHLAVSSR